MDYTLHNTLRNGIHVDLHSVQMDLQTSHMDFAKWFILSIMYYKAMGKV